jgi:DNA (cytosine-5)-methyltransferase 1
MQLLREANYELGYKILNVSDFNVLQDRKRVILIGWNRRINFRYPDFEINKPEILIKDILSDLPELRAGQGEEYTERYKTDNVNEYLLKNNIRTQEDIVLNHIARPHRDVDLEIYKFAIEMANQGMRMKYNDLPERLQFHENKETFLDRFKVVFADKPVAQTIVSHIAKDGHYYIHPDINQLRSLTVREAARIQSFPDNYKFEGPRTHQFIQVGNAVPPLMARKIAAKLKEVFRNGR